MGYHGAGMLRPPLLALLAVATGCHALSGLSEFGVEAQGGSDGATGSVSVSGSGGSASGSSSSSGMGGGDVGGGAVGYAARVLDDEPLVYWRLDELPGSLPYDEVSESVVGGYENGATLGEAGVLPDNDSAYFGGAARLAVDDEVLPIDFAGMDDFSIEAWVKLTAYPSNPDRGLMYKQDGQNGNNHGWRLSIRDDGRLRFVRRRDGDNDDCFSNEALPLETWVHVVGTFDGTTQRLFVDGQAHDQTVAQRAVLDTAARFTLASVYGAQPAFDGWLDEVAIYDYALPPQVIAKHYNAGKPD